MLGITTANPLSFFFNLTDFLDTREGVPLDELVYENYEFVNCSVNSFSSTQYQTHVQDEVFNSIRRYLRYIGHCCLQYNWRPSSSSYWFESCQQRQCGSAECSLRLSRFSVTSEPCCTSGNCRGTPDFPPRRRILVGINSNSRQLPVTAISKSRYRILFNHGLLWRW